MSWIKDQMIFILDSQINLIFKITSLVLGEPALCYTYQPHGKRGVGFYNMVSNFVFTFTFYKYC